MGRVLTLDQLKKRGRQLANRRPLSEEDEDSIDLLLLFCKKATEFWAFLFALFGVS